MRNRYRWDGIFVDRRRELQKQVWESTSDSIQRANGLRIDKLSANYLNVTSAVHLYAQDYEAPALYKSGSTYFMFASHESGWCKLHPDNETETKTDYKHSTKRQHILHSNEPQWTLVSMGNLRYNRIKHIQLTDLGRGEYQWSSDVLPSIYS